VSGTLGAVANCAHGFPQGECLICQTLGNSPSPAQSAQSAATKTKPAKTKASTPAELLATNSLPNGRTSALSTRDHEPSPTAGRRSGMSSLWAILVVIVVGGLLLWAFAGVVSVAFHIAEYVAIAVLAGWLGYKLGHARGRRGH
jgi:hypothetical protein